MHDVQGKLQYAKVRLLRDASGGLAECWLSDYINTPGMLDYTRVVDTSGARRADSGR